MSDDEDDNPLKESRGMEPRLALLQLFSIGSSKKFYDNQYEGTHLLSRSLSAPALHNDQQQSNYHDHNSKRMDVAKESVDTNARFHSPCCEVLRSSSQSSIDTFHHTNVINLSPGKEISGKAPEMATNAISSADATNIARNDIAFDFLPFDVQSSVEQLLVDRSNKGAANKISRDFTNNSLQSDIYLDNNIAESRRSPVNTTASRSFWYAQHRQAKDFRIFDTKGTGGVGVPEVGTRSYRSIVDLSQSNNLNIKHPLVLTRVGRITVPKASEKLKTIHRHSSSVAATQVSEQYLSKGSPLVESVPFICKLNTTYKGIMPTLAMPAASAAVNGRRGPPNENGESSQIDNVHIRSNGRGAPIRTHISTSNEMIQPISLSGAGINSMTDDDPNTSSLRNDIALQQPTPLFERLVTEEVQELRAYVRIVENQNRRLVELERVHGDLEERLEIESKARQQLEATLEAREREWAERLEHIERDRDQWKNLVEAEKIKNSKLINEVSRKDQDIHRMLQRKYDNEITRSTRNARPAPAAATTTATGSTDQREKPRNSSPGTTMNKTVPDQHNEREHLGPLHYLCAVGSAEDVRNRNVKSLLMDVFGM